MNNIWKPNFMNFDTYSEMEKYFLTKYPPN